MCIPTRGRPEELARALASIGRSTYPVAQVVVSDDLADSIAEGICRDAPVEVDYVRGPGRGVGANRNRAVAEARSEIVAFLDDDGVLLPDFLETAVARMRTGEQRYGFGRVIVSGCVVTQHGELIPAHEQTFLGYQAKPLATSEGLRTLAMNAVIVPIHVFREVQFDPQLVYGYEEVDLAIRAAAAGYVIVDCPEAQNFHESETPLRDYHDRYAEASRLHVTLRRYALTERSPLRALVFGVIAPLHVIAADLKRLGPRGVRQSAVTLGLAARMLWRARLRTVP